MRTPDYGLSADEQLVFLNLLAGVGDSRSELELEGRKVLVVGGVFVIEALSVMIQVASFKTTKRRVFKMSPLHHHFEIQWERRFGQRTVEPKVVFRFLIVAILFALLSLSTLKLR